MTTSPSIILDVEPVTHDLDRVVGYVFKTVKSGRLPYGDAVIVLPRTVSELD